MLKWLCNSVATATLVVVPVAAQAAPGAPVALVASHGAASQGAASHGAAGAIESFYRARGNAPLWFEHKRDSAVAAELVGLLRRATLDGLASGPQLAGQVEAAIIAARSGDTRMIADAERIMSSAWIDYVQALRAPTPGMIYGDPAMPSTAPPASIILRNAATAPSLGAYLASVSQVNPIYSALRNAALAEAQATGGSASPILRANLARARAIPATGRFIMVDAAAARLWMYEDGRATGSMKVIVGKPQYATPMIASVIHYATLNPYWHVPDHLVRELVAVNVVKQGTNYLKERGYEVVSEYSDNAVVLSSSSVDWKAVAAGEATARVRQLPGENNSMGNVKFSFTNGEGIYLHDTPDKALFEKETRTLSNGCVRLEDAPRLARWLMGSDPRAMSERPEQHVRLPQAVPIYITYLTASDADGRLSYVNDVYGRDTHDLTKTTTLK